MTRRSGNPADHFHEAQRHLAGLTARAERRALLWLAPRTPPVITSDHLTLLGLVSMTACGALYTASGRHPWLLLLVNLALALNWLGDSLDGTLARHRGAERPRFGFYVDHLADAFGALLVLAGVALSGLMSPLVAAVLLGAYFLLAIETYLATYAIGRFKISWGPLGGTELRILLAAMNVIVLFRPRVSVAGASWLLFDVVGVPASAVLLILAVTAGFRGTRALARIEGWAPAGDVRTPASARPCERLVEGEAMRRDGPLPLLVRPDGASHRASVSRVAVVHGTRRPLGRGGRRGGRHRRRGDLARGSPRGPGSAAAGEWRPGRRP